MLNEFYEAVRVINIDRVGLEVFFALFSVPFGLSA